MPGWLLDRLEDRRFWFHPQDRLAPKSVAQLADEVARDRVLASVLALWEGRPDVPVQQRLLKLLADEAVPFLAAYRYKEAGLRKRRPTPARRGRRGSSRAQEGRSSAGRETRAPIGGRRGAAGAPGVSSH